MSDTIILPRGLAIQLMEHAQSRPDEEVCGLVAEAADGTLTALRVPNVSSQPGDSFEMAPETLLRAQQKMRDGGQRLWAVYHSHPAAGAAPSPRDLALSGAREALQLIVSLDIRGVLQLRAWRFTNGDVVEVPLRVR